MRMKRSVSSAPRPGGSSEPPLLSTPTSLLCLISEGLDALPAGEPRARRSGGVRAGRLEVGGSDVILDGENQTCAAAQQLLLAGVQFTLQRLLGGAAAPFAIRAPARPAGRIPSTT